MKALFNTLALALALFATVSATVSTASAKGVMMLGEIDAPSVETNIDNPRIPITQEHIPLTILQSGSYYLASDLRANASGGTMINIQTSDVTIDFNGFTVAGQSEVGYATTCIIAGNVENISLFGGTVRDCTYNGMSAINADLVQLDRMRFLANGNEGAILGNGALVTRSTFAHNESRGIRTMHGAVVEAVVAYNNGSGVYTRDSSSIETVAAYQNSGVGVHGGAASTVTNAASAENGLGVEVGDASSVSHSTAYLSTYEGIVADQHSVIQAVASVANGSYGIWASLGTIFGSTVADNDSGTVWGWSNIVGYTKQVD